MSAPRLIEAIVDHFGSIYYRELRAILADRYAENTIKTAIKRLKDDGSIVSISRGVYRRPEG